MTEQAPNRDSRVTLGDERDALGMPVVKLDWRLTELDYHSIRTASRQLAVELGRSGLGRMQPWCAHETDEEIDRRITPGAHHMGTTRMHSDPSRGVVDTQCRIHGTRNVYVASSSVFPTAGHAAPTITIVALAIRLAAHLRASWSEVEDVHDPSSCVDDSRGAATAGAAMARTAARDRFRPVPGGLRPAGGGASEASPPPIWVNTAPERVTGSAYRGRKRWPRRSAISAFRSNLLRLFSPPVEARVCRGRSR